MSKKRWMMAVIAEAKKSGDATAQVLPFARQVRHGWNAKPVTSQKKRASA